MAFFNGWPWTQFQEQNLDWIIRKLKEYEQRLGSVEEALAALKDTIAQDVYDLMVQWLNDGTLAGLIAGALEHKEWMIEDINNIPAGVTFNLGDTITTTSANYVVVASGLPFGIYQLYPVYYTKLEDLGLEADGITDDSAKLQAAYNLLGDLDLCKQTVLIASKITLKSNSRIRNGKIKWDANLGIGIEGDSISNIVLEDLELDPSASVPLGKKVSINNSSDILIQRIYAHDWYGTLFRLNGNTDQTVKDSLFVNSSGGTGDVGAALYSNGGSNLSYDNLQSKNLTDNLIYLDGTNAIRDVTISNIRGSGHTGTDNPHVIAVYGDCQNVTITNVTIKNCDNGIRIQTRNSVTPDNVAVSNVTIIDAAYSGIDITGTGSGHQRISLANMIIRTNTQDGIFMKDINYVSASNAIITGGRAGVKLTNCQRIALTNITCYIEQTNANAGISLDANCQYITVMFCKVVNYKPEALSGFQDLRTVSTGINRFYFCTAINSGSGSLVLEGFDFRTAMNFCPNGTYALTQKSMFFTNQADLANIPYATAGDIAFSRAGGNAGWHYTGTQWVAN